MKCKTYDENVYVNIVRQSTAMTVHFYELLEGDMIATGAHRGLIVGCDAFKVEDNECYNGWRFNDGNGIGFFPEDFGAHVVHDPTEKTSEAAKVYAVFSVIELNNFSDENDKTPPDHHTLHFIYASEEAAKKKVKELKEKDAHMVRAFGCDPTSYIYREYTLM